MKYYGFEYGGLTANYQIESAPVYDTPYKALAAVNSAWDRVPDPYERRTLVIVRACDAEDTPAEESIAFFQFKDSRSCSKFVAEQSEIIWSTSESQKTWNGNGEMMT